MILKYFQFSNLDRKNYIQTILQSAVLAGRHVIHQAYKELEERYSDGSVITSLNAFFVTIT